MAEQSEETLRAWAEAAASAFLRDPKKRSLTSCVIEVLRPHARNITNEHARRVCEMTYHKAFRGIFRANGPAREDRHVDFGEDGPPRAEEVANVLRLETVASASDPAGKPQPGGGMPKHTSGKIAGDVRGGGIPRRTWRPPDQPKIASATLVAPPPAPPPPVPANHIAAERAEGLWRVQRELSEARGRFHLADSALKVASDRLDSVLGRYAAEEHGHEILRAVAAGVEHLPAEYQDTAYTRGVYDRAVVLLDAAGSDLTPAKLGSYGSIDPRNPVTVAAADAMRAANERRVWEYTISRLGQEEQAMKLAGLGGAAVDGMRNAAHFVSALPGQAASAVGHAAAYGADALRSGAARAAEGIRSGAHAAARTVSGLPGQVGNTLSQGVIHGAQALGRGAVRASEGLGKVTLEGAQRFSQGGSNANPLLNTAMAGVGAGGLATSVPEATRNAYAGYQRMVDPHTMRLGDT